MYKITLNFESENSMPAVSEELASILEQSRIPVPRVTVKSEDKISFKTQKLPTNAEAQDIGETYRISFNKVCEEQSKNIRKVSISFVGITDIEEI